MDCFNWIQSNERRKVKFLLDLSFVTSLQNFSFYSVIIRLANVKEKNEMMNIQLDDRLKTYMQENHLQNILITSMMCHT